MQREFPILEFDPTRRAMIEPSEIIKPRDVPEHCVVCFFNEVVEKIARERNAKIVSHQRWEGGERPLYEIDVDGKRLAMIQPGVGAPLVVGILEEIIPFGLKKFIACGGCGVLDKDIAVGHIIIPSSAVRDEGTSYHYLPPARDVNASPEAVTAIERVLTARKMPYLVSKTWTTDAPYRETAAKIRSRKTEGCLTVEMEAAAFFALAQFRGVTFGQILYAGDDVSGGEWDSRGWHTRTEIRENLFWLAVEACLEL